MITAAIWIAYCGIMRCVEVADCSMPKALLGALLFTTAAILATIGVNA